MKILVVGGGGREHAIIRSLKKNSNITEIFACPGNGGIAADATCVAISATEIEKIVEFAVENKIDYAVVAPDDPLVLGCVDALEAKGIPCFGPRANAAIIEGSKVFSKNLMKKYNIPTATYEVFEDMEAALNYLETAPIPTVVKADGLALGKGVIIAQTRQEAKDAVRDMMEVGIFGKSGSRVVIEEFLTGPEVSVLAFTDGNVVKPMISSMDHKRIGDNDTGLNTGGMGTIAPNPYYTAEIAAECMETIFIPTIQAMNAEGRTFKGCLYFGLMLTPNGPKVIEYNCRFGDPETQVVLPLLEIESELDEYDGKIKISYKNLVQEWCDKYGCDRPVYETYQTHEGFVSTCYIKEHNIKGEGWGSNRKEAEKTAAELVYPQLEDIESSFASVEISFENAVNMLQEYCQSKDIPKPEYKTVNDIIFENNTHEFTVLCILNGRYTEGKGERVKEAKKQAAYKMLGALGLL